MTLVSSKTFLQHSQQLSRLSNMQLDKIAEVAIYKQVKKRGQVFGEWSDMNKVYLLIEGTVKLMFKSPSEKTLIKCVVHDDSLFGINVFTNKKKRNEIAEAISDISYYEIPTDIFKQLVVDNQQFATHVLNLIITRLQDLEERLENLVFKSAKDRIIHFIKRTGERNGIKIGIDECLINHGMSHQEIALFVDTSRQTVARVFSELKRDNIIHFSPRKPRKLLIRNVLSL